jgi:hypothetical protein
MAGVTHVNGYMMLSFSPPEVRSVSALSRISVTFLGVKI